MLMTDFRGKYIRKAAQMILLVSFLTVASLGVMHGMQDAPYLIDLVMPPIVASFLLGCFILVRRRPETIAVILPLTMLVMATAMCLPAWYFTMLALMSPEIRLVEVLPPISSAILPITMGMVLFFKPRIALFAVLATWACFVSPILVYLLYHPDELNSPRGLEMLVTMGPVMTFTLVLLLFSQDMHRQIQRLLSERADLKKLSEQDSLTGLYNRRAGEALLENYIELTDSQFGIIMFDIDHFKRINDSHGHDVGDMVLREVVKRCSDRLRAGDLFVRWGGEEFLIFVLAADIKEIAQLAEQLREFISERPMGDGLTVTASFGVTGYHHLDTRESLLKRGDELLYQAKESGRNRVIAGEKGALTIDFPTRVQRSLKTGRLG